VVAGVGVGAVKSERIPVADKVTQVGDRNGETQTFAQRQLHVDHTYHFAFVVEQRAATIAWVNLCGGLDVDDTLNIAIAGADDAWMHEDGVVTEGSSNNAYIVTQDDVIVTRPASSHILNGITRRAVLRLAEETGMRVDERTFTVEEALGAKEAFVTSATTFVWPVVKIDGTEIGSGAPGPVAIRLRALYIEEALGSLN